MAAFGIVGYKAERPNLGRIADIVLTGGGLREGEQRRVQTESLLRPGSADLIITAWALVWFGVAYAAPRLENLA